MCFATAYCVTALGNRNFAAPLQSYGTTVANAVTAVIDQAIIMWHMTVYEESEF